MARTKISEFSATAGSNTDIDSINLAEGCAPSGINDAIRELMSQLKDFQTGAVGDSFNGPVGSTTAGTGAFTTLAASSTTTLSGLTASTALALDASKNVVSVTNTGTGSNVLATSPTFVTPVLGTPSSGTVTNLTGTASININGTVGATTPAAGAFTTLTASSTLTVTGAGSIEGLTVGRGAGAVASNTAVGASALAANTSGAQNTTVGNQAGATTNAAYLTAVGYQAARYNTGDGNTAIGTNALLVSSGTGGTGSNNTAIGKDALYTNTTASNNTAVGYQAGYSNTTGTGSVLLGYKAGYSSTTDSFNIFIGYQAGYTANLNGGSSTLNVAVGANAGYSLTTGTRNNFFGNGVGGAGAGYYVTTGSKNTILGGYDGNQGGLDIRTLSNYVVLSDGDGNPRLHFDGTTWYTFTLAAGAGTNALKFNSSTGAWTYDTSSARYKDNIRDSIYGLSHVMQMRSTQFEYKDTGRSDVGLIAEELDPIIPELVMKNKDGQPDSVSYDRMVSVLVKAIQELKAEFDAYKATHP